MDGRRGPDIDGTDLNGGGGGTELIGGSGGVELDGTDCRRGTELSGSGGGIELDGRDCRRGSDIDGMDLNGSDGTGIGGKNNPLSFCSLPI